MPVTHVAGLTYGVLLPVTSGVTTVLMDTWEARAGARRLLERERITVMISTPVFMRTMIDHSASTTTDTARLRLFSLGGAGVAPAMVREGAAALRLLVQAHVRLDRVPDAHDRPARRHRSSATPPPTAC